eukprot:12435054-Heterocapsa_arctica.AAC.1
MPDAGLRRARRRVCGDPLVGVQISAGQVLPPAREVNRVLRAVRGIAQGGVAHGVLLDLALGLRSRLE